MCVPAGMSVFVMVCETRPLPVYPIVFQHPGLPVGGKRSIFNFIHHHVRLSLLVSLIWHPVCASSLRRRGRVKKKRLQYFEFGLQYLVQPLGVNPTYSTFNILMIFGIKEKSIILTKVYNVFLAIATNIHQWLETGFVVQGHICVKFKFMFLALAADHTCLALACLSSPLLLDLLFKCLACADAISDLYVGSGCTILTFKTASCGKAMTGKGFGSDIYTL